MPKILTTQCDYTRGDAIRDRAALSEAGFVNDGEEIFVPWGKTDQWNLILSIYHAGVNEIGSQKDNALMEVKISERELGNMGGWEISSRSSFRYWNLNKSVDRPVEVRYLMVAK